MVTAFPQTARPEGAVHHSAEGRSEKAMDVMDGIDICDSGLALANQPCVFIPSIAFSDPEPCTL